MRGRGSDVQPCGFGVGGRRACEAVPLRGSVAGTPVRPAASEPGEPRGASDGRAGGLPTPAAAYLNQNPH